jgi:biopolymer transport protein ExbD
MAGVDVGGGGKGGRRSLDSEINMIPFIDLLMVTIAFLLITAVWSHMARLEADAQVPGPPDKPLTEDTPPKEKWLHIEMRTPEKFVLIWKEGANVVSTTEVPRREDVTTTNGIRVVRFGDLAEKIKSEWNNVGQHRTDSDFKFDQAVLHTDNDTPYSHIVGAMDAIYHPKRPLKVGSQVKDVPAFNVTFSVN